MNSKNKIKYILVVVIIIVAGLAMADSLGYFNTGPYAEIRIGSQVHYIPNDRDPDVPLNRFPTTPPAPNEKINREGKIVPKN